MRPSRLQRVLSIAVLLAAASATANPQFICYPVQPGDSASLMALRLTGDVNNRREPWFQILDPFASRFIPKADYEHIQPGWQACIEQETVGYTPVTAARPSYNLAGLVHGLGWWWLTFVCAGTLAAWIAAQSYSDRRNATIHALERYGAAFVREFERPLRQSWAPNAGGALGSKSHAAGAATGPGSKSHSSYAAAVLASKSATQSEVAALRSQLSIRPFGARVEILVAPAVGHLYPNLSDHRRNVEYDVRRVIAMLGDSRFVCGDLIARGPWVVIPFRFKPRGR